MTTTITRHHDISCGHRVTDHEGGCAHLHGHNYRVHFTCSTNDIDPIGRVIDFSEIKHRLCQWLEDNWDHRFLVWVRDPIGDKLVAVDPYVTRVTFNPTAENMARFLVEIVGPAVLAGTSVVLDSVTIEETRKCSATYTRDRR